MSTKNSSCQKSNERDISNYSMKSKQIFRKTYNDRARSWEIAYEAPPTDGTLPSGWYAQGLGRTGFRIYDELYGPFKTKAMAQAMAMKVDASWRKVLMDEIRRGLRPASDATSTREPDAEAWAKWAESNKHLQKYLLSKSQRQH